TTTKYEFGTLPLSTAKLFKNTVTAPPNPPANPTGKPQTTWLDVHGNVLAVDDGTTPLTTRYDYDPLGQLLTVTDPAGSKSIHTYDLLGRRTSTLTPDGGLNEFQFDGAGNMIAQTTPNLRAKSQKINYSYDIDRLIGIAYPVGTPNVTYTYGGPGAPANTAGRVTTIADGARRDAASGVGR